MEENLVAAYKSLKAVTADPAFSSLPTPQQEAVKSIMGTIKAGLVSMAQKEAVAEVEATLAAQ